MNTRMHIYIYIHKHTHTHTYIYILLTYTHAYTYMHTYMHTVSPGYRAVTETTTTLTRSRSRSRYLHSSILFTLTKCPSPIYPPTPSTGCALPAVAALQAPQCSCLPCTLQGLPRNGGDRTEGNWPLARRTADKGTGTQLCRRPSKLCGSLILSWRGLMRGFRLVQSLHLELTTMSQSLYHDCIYESCGYPLPFVSVCRIVSEAHCGLSQESTQDNGACKVCPLYFQWKQGKPLFCSLPGRMLSSIWGLGSWPDQRDRNELLTKLASDLAVLARFSHTQERWFKSAQALIILSFTQDKNYISMNALTHTHIHHLWSLITFHMWLELCINTCICIYIYVYIYIYIV
jgi:hypothetical protein